MKGLIVAIAVICCATQLKAQQAPFLPKQQPWQQFKVFPDSIKGKDLAFKLMDSARRLTNPQIRQNSITSDNIDNMPIVRPQTRSSIPVAQTDRTAYTMPVVGVNNPRIYIMPKPAEPGAVANDVK